jgi:hypothetical protein
LHIVLRNALGNWTSAMKKNRKRTNRSLRDLLNRIRRFFMPWSSPPNLRNPKTPTRIAWHPCAALPTGVGRPRSRSWTKKRSTKYKAMDNGGPTTREIRIGTHFRKFNSSAACSEPRNTNHLASACRLAHLHTERASFPRSVNSLDVRTTQEEQCEHALRSF